MTPVFPARRRAEEFAALVEDTPTSGPDARYSDLLHVVGALRDAPPVEARPEFVANLRERLMVAAESELVPTDIARLTLPARNPSRDRRIAAAVGGLALVGATTSMAMAAQSALPGDVLYPVKRAIENVHTNVVMGENQKGSTLLANASGRLDEASQLSHGGDARDELAIADTLNAFTDQSAEASDLLLSDYADHGDRASVEELRAFAATSLDELTALEPQVPEEARDELFHAAQVLIQIDAAAHQACPACSGGITKIPPIYAPASSGSDYTGVQESADQGSATPRRVTQGQADDPKLPDLDQNALPPGSVLSQGGGSTGGSAQQPGGVDDPISTLTQGLTGGGSAPTSNPTTGTPSAPDVGGTLDGAGDTVDGVTGGLNPLNP
jgi:Domain of unknown function (DUF5667)